MVDALFFFIFFLGVLAVRKKRYSRNGLSLPNLDNLLNGMGDFYIK
jgi:hypothetical protein